MNTMVAAFLAFALNWNNPHLYMAYEHKAGLWPKDQNYAVFYHEYLDSTKSSESPFYKRKPNSGDEISHDELLGIFYNLNGHARAKRIAQDILKEGGKFYSQAKNKDHADRYVMKHFDLRGIVRFHADGSVDVLDQVLWSAHIIRRAHSSDQGCSSHLRTWIAAKFADQVYLPHIAMSWYRVVMHNKGKSASDCLKAYFPNHPEIHVTAAY